MLHAAGASQSARDDLTIARDEVAAGAQNASRLLSRSAAAPFGDHV